MDCRDAALRFLEHRERSAYEIKLHLISKGFQEEEIKEELEFLEEMHYLDDARFCSNYIRYGISKGRGPVRLQHELADKGINAVLIQKAIQESFDRQAEKDAAMKEAGKLLRSDTERPDEKTLAKIGRKLAYLGFHTDVIYDVIGQLRKS